MLVQRSLSVNTPRLLALLAAGLFALLTCAAAATAAQAEQPSDPCLVGNWTYSGPVINGLNLEEMTGVVDLAIPYPTGGDATLSVDIQTELGIRHYVGAAPEAYAVTSASTPMAAAGSLDWATTPAGVDVIPPEPHSGAYSCTESSLMIAVPLALGGPLTFERSSAAPVPVSVAVLTQGSGVGSVVSEPAGIDCPGTCSTLLWPGKPVQLRARLTASFFLGWTGSCTPQAPVSSAGGFGSLQERLCQVSSSGEVTAIFGGGLQLDITGEGRVIGATTAPPIPDGFSTPPMIDCSAQCWSYFAQEATLHATPAPEYNFLEWAGACNRRAPEPCQVDVTGVTPVTAIFTSAQRTLANLKGSFARSFKGKRYAQTTMRPGTSLWRAQNKTFSGRSAYFGLEQPATSAQAEKLYNVAVWGNRAECLQEFEVTADWSAYIGRVASGKGTQVLAHFVHGHALTVQQLLHKNWIRAVGDCVHLPR
jgi:hypothetical protein